MKTENGRTGQSRRISAAPAGMREYLIRSINNLGLALSFAKSEIHGNNAQTWLGYFINLLQILVATAVYWLIFGVFLHVDTGAIPYPLFVLTGMIPWVYFSKLVQEAGNSLISSQHLLSKVYFPRVILPISKALPGLVDFGFSLMTALLIIILSGMPLRIEIPMVAVFLLIIIFSGIALGLWISSISVRYRDLSRLIPYLINFGFFLTPVFYPATLVPEQLEYILYINPAAFAIEGMRWALFGTAFPEVQYLISLVPVTVLFVWGWHNYRKKEKEYADII
ncbi:MAG: ABC transporter permease [Bacteroidales bacterium]